MNLGQWIGLIAILLSLYILWQLKEVLLLIFAAIVLATTLNRLARRFQRSGMRRGFAVALSVGIFIAGIIGFSGSSSRLLPFSFNNSPIRFLEV